MNGNLKLSCGAEWTRLSPLKGLCFGWRWLSTWTEIRMCMVTKCSVRKRGHHHPISLAVSFGVAHWLLYAVTFSSRKHSHLKWLRWCFWLRKEWVWVAGIFLIKLNDIINSRLHKLNLDRCFIYEIPLYY